MRGLLVAATAWLGCASAAWAAPGPVDYRLSPELRGGQLTALVVKMSFRGEASGLTPFALPEGYGAAQDGWRVVRDLRIDGAVSVDTPDPGHRLIHAKPDARLTVSYRVVPMYDHDPKSEEAEQYRPTVRPSWFEAVGSSVFAEPYVQLAFEGKPITAEDASGPIKIIRRP